MAPDRNSSEAAEFLHPDELEDEGTFYDEDAAAAHVLSGVLRPFLERNQATLKLVEYDLNYASPPWRWRATATLEVRGKSVMNAVGLGRCDCVG